MSFEGVTKHLEPSAHQHLELWSDQLSLGHGLTRPRWPRMKESRLLRVDGCLKKRLGDRRKKRDEGQQQSEMSMLGLRIVEGRGGKKSQDFFSTRGQLIGMSSLGLVMRTEWFSLRQEGLLVPDSESRHFSSLLNVWQE